MKELMGDRIKRLREAFNLTQAQLGERVGVSKQEVCLYETNVRQPGGDVLCNLAEVFHISTDELLGLGKKYMINADGLTEEEQLIYTRLIALASEKNKRLGDI